VKQSPQKESKADCFGRSSLAKTLLYTFETASSGFFVCTAGKPKLRANSAHYNVRLLLA
jgi:hypothetical protein